MKKTVVTGGAGFIGSSLVRLLLDRGWSVTVVDDFSVGKKENLPLKRKNLKVIKADIRDSQKMLSVFKNAKTVFHLAVQGVRKSINDPSLVHDVNAGGTLSVLGAALKNKVGKFVYVSSSEVYGSGFKVPMDEDHPLNPTTVYGASKLTGEYYSLAYKRTYGLPVVIVRPFNTYGYREHFEGQYGEVIPRFIVRALNGLPLQIFGDGNQTRDFIFVTDTVEGLWQVVKKGKIGEIYNIARGEEVSINDLAQVILRTLKVRVPLEHLAARPGDVSRHFANARRAHRQLGFKAQIHIKRGIKKYIAWFKREYPNPQTALKYYEEENW